MKKIYAGLSILIVSISLMFQNCSEKKFQEVDPVEKAELLDSHVGIKDPSVPEQNRVRDDDARLPEQNPLRDDATNVDVRTESKVNYSYSGNTVHVTRWCRNTDRINTLRDASSLTISIQSQGVEICKASGEVYLSSAINDGKIVIPGCDLSKVKESVHVLVTDQDNVPINATQSMTRRAERADKFNIALVVYNAMGPQSLIDPACDMYSASPLVVDMRDKEELQTPFSLTSPIDGILFDILGLNSNPQAYAKKQISWLTDSKIMPLVLPSKGKTFGIDQLFGDNTFGPDGLFASDGFHALAKYDGLDILTKKKKISPDGLINQEDDVYNHLRLWEDKNLNGKIEAGELHRLDDSGVIAIDLNYDKKYFERDQHGNEIKYKSVVKMKDGPLRPMFDIWFVIDEGIQSR